jgi:hypothetical protein
MEAAKAATETSPEVAEGTTSPAPSSQGNYGSESRAPETGEGERDETERYLSRDAASYGRRLRETEAERDRLREQLDRLQRADVEPLASGTTSGFDPRPGPAGTT